MSQNSCISHKLKSGLVSVYRQWNVCFGNAPIFAIQINPQFKDATVAKMTTYLKFGQISPYDGHISVSDYTYTFGLVPSDPKNRDVKWQFFSRKIVLTDLSFLGQSSLFWYLVQ